MNAHPQCNNQESIHKTNLFQWVRHVSVRLVPKSVNRNNQQQYRSQPAWRRQESNPISDHMPAGSDLLPSRAKVQSTHNFNIPTYTSPIVVDDDRKFANKKPYMCANTTTILRAGRLMSESCHKSQPIPIPIISNSLYRSTVRLLSPRLFTYLEMSVV